MYVLLLCIKNEKPAVVVDRRKVYADASELVKYNRLSEHAEVARHNQILSLGYNGMPIGCDDDAMPWDREGDPLDTKYMYVCHAELNAILNSAHNNLKGARVYVTLFPCNECAKAIIQSGISEVVYYGDKYHDSDSSVAARFMFKKAGIRLTSYTPSGRKIELEL